MGSLTVLAHSKPETFEFNGNIEERRAIEAKFKELMRAAGTWHSP